MKLRAAIPLMFVSTIALAAPKATFEATPVPATSSPTPVATEWNTATSIALKWSFGCSAQLKREWVRVSCPGAPVRLAVIDGDRSDVTFVAEPTPRASSTVIFPLRRGERRAIQLWSIVEDETLDVRDRGTVRLVAAYWLEDEARPVLTIQ